MAKAPVLSEILKLSVAERLDLIGEVWDSINDAGELPAPDWHIDELNRRLQDEKDSPDDEMSLAEFKKRLVNRK